MYFMLPFLYHYSNSLLETDFQSFMSHPEPMAHRSWCKPGERVTNSAQLLAPGEKES